MRRLAAPPRRRAETVDGVDLSAAMLRKGQALGLFRQLLHSAVVTYLHTTEELES